MQTSDHKMFCYAQNTSELAGSNKRFLFVAKIIREVPSNKVNKKELEKNGKMEFSLKWKFYVHTVEHMEKHSVQQQKLNKYIWNKKMNKEDSGTLDGNY